MTRESISVLIPTYNEAENISEILSRSIACLDSAGKDHEILVIDDASSDGTADIAMRFLSSHVSVIRHKGARSLSLSVLEGIKRASGSIIVVMDADGSHPPELICTLAEEISKGNDLVVASRYVKGGKVKSFPLTRRMLSRCACFLGSAVTNIRDNTSGFFAVRKDKLDLVGLSPLGFKIGLEIFVKTDLDSRKEIPYTFIYRRKGNSKFSFKSLVQYIIQLFFLFHYRLFSRQRYRRH